MARGVKGQVGRRHTLFKVPGGSGRCDNRRTALRAPAINYIASPPGQADCLHVLLLAFTRD